MEWAICTEKPIVAIEATPLKSHPLLAIRPIEAEGNAPSRPTIAASIYCMRMLDSWASMAGNDIIRVIFTSLGVERLSPVLIALRWSFDIKNRLNFDFAGRVFNVRTKFQVETELSPVFLFLLLGTGIGDDAVHLLGYDVDVVFVFGPYCLIPFESGEVELAGACDEKRGCHA